MHADKSHPEKGPVPERPGQGFYLPSPAAIEWRPVTVMIPNNQFMPMSIAASIKTWARRIKRDAVMLWFAQRHPDTPILARALCILTVAYALSPIDLIPDFIPVLGFLDDAILLPAMIWLAVRLLPSQVIQHCRQEADAWMEARGKKPASLAGAVGIVLLWLALAWLCLRLLAPGWTHF
jgi:uncharacterized membrane protein YkvA (DUF1232 family)